MITSFVSIFFRRWKKLVLNVEPHFPNRLNTVQALKTSRLQEKIRKHLLLRYFPGTYNHFCAISNFKAPAHLGEGVHDIGRAYWIVEASASGRYMQRGPPFFYEILEIEMHLRITAINSFILPVDRRWLGIQTLNPCSLCESGVKVWLMKGAAGCVWALIKLFAIMLVSRCAQKLHAHSFRLNTIPLACYNLCAERELEFQGENGLKTWFIDFKWNLLLD